MASQIHALETRTDNNKKGCPKDITRIQNTTTETINHQATSIKLNRQG